ncbi:MAG: DNA-binding protein WhiA [Lachnospiraceae bacterium]|nr:DNA-binding protein WhiA [Lachnospiraceae bacterium]
MSFSAEVKEELLTVLSNSRHCRLAELGGLITMTGYMDGSIRKQDKDSQAAGIKIEKLIKLLDIDFDYLEDLKGIKLHSKGTSYVIEKQLIERICCKQAFLRGAFLATGSITDPQKGYHMEIVCELEEQAQILMDAIKSFQVEPKLVMRKKYYVVYLKDGSMIVDLLNVMGAHISLMNMENVRILKDMRNSVNRRVNCETANINKTVSAAVKQIEDIRYIEEKKGLKILPVGLRVIAELRLEEPELSLKDLGERLNPPIGKSGVNHRLRKISEIAMELRRSYNDY